MFQVMASRRPRKTNHGIADYNALLITIKDIIINKVPVRAGSRENNINQTSLRRYLKKFQQEVPDISAHGDEELLRIVRRIASYSASKMVWQ